MSPSNDQPHGLTVEYRVRFDESAPDGLARTSTLLRYAQDVAWLHSEALGFDRTWYRERGLAWVVRGVELEVLRPIRMGQMIAVSTAVTGFRRIWARRRTEGRTPDGTLLAWSHTDWVIIDGRGAPVRIPGEFPAAFHVPAGGFEPVRVGALEAPAGAAVVRGRVRPQDLDPMAHANNAAYLDYLEEAVLAAGPAGIAAVAAIPRRIRLEYVVPAGPGQELVASAWVADDPGGPGSWAHRLTGGDGRELARGLLVV